MYLCGGDTIDNTPFNKRSLGVAFPFSFGMDRSLISRCSSSTAAGGLYVDSSCTVSLTDSEIKDCVAGGSGGGGVAVGPGAKLFVVRSELNQNMAPSGVGGSIAVHGGQVRVLKFILGQQGV